MYYYEKQTLLVDMFFLLVTRMLSIGCAVCHNAP